jgi:hypothetical protein
MKLKMKLKLKSNMIIILLIGILIFLGVIWLYKINNNKEGQISATDAVALNSSFMKQMKDAGLTPPSSSVINNMLDTIGGIVTSEATVAAQRAEARSAADAETPAVNTVPQELPTISFFEGSKFGDAFCKINRGDPTNLTNKCSSLTSESCNATDCCVWVNGEKCLAGDADGPTTPMGSTSTVDADYYSYKYQCYGNCNSPIIVPASSTTSILGASTIENSGGLIGSIDALQTAMIG